MNCDNNTGLMIIGDTYERSFIFQIPDPSSPDPENPLWIPMDLGLYNVRYYLYGGGKYLVDKTTGFPTTGDQIDIEVLPAITLTASPILYKEVFIFTLISNPNKIRTERIGNVLAKQRNS